MIRASHQVPSTGQYSSTWCPLKCEASARSPRCSSLRTSVGSSPPVLAPACRVTTRDMHAAAVHLGCLHNPARGNRLRKEELQIFPSVSAQAQAACVSHALRLCIFGASSLKLMRGGSTLNKKSTFVAAGSLKAKGPLRWRLDGRKVLSGLPAGLAPAVCQPGRLCDSHHLHIPQPDLCIILP